LGGDGKVLARKGHAAFAAGEEPTVVSTLHCTLMYTPKGSCVNTMYSSSAGASAVDSQSRDTLGASRQSPGVVANMHSGATSSQRVCLATHCTRTKT